MTLIHIVIFKFRQDVSAEHKATFVKELKTLRGLSCVKDRKLWVGSPSVTNPIEKSQGFQIALVSFHHDLAALEVYQDSKEHERVTHNLLWPYKEDVVRFDFKIPESEDEMRVGEMMVKPIVALDYGPSQTLHIDHISDNYND